MAGRQINFLVWPQDTPHTFWARKMRTRFGRNKVELENLSPKLCVHITLFLYLYIYLPLFALIEMTSI